MTPDVLFKCLLGLALFLCAGAVVVLMARGGVFPEPVRKECLAVSRVLEARRRRIIGRPGSLQFCAYYGMFAAFLGLTWSRFLTTPTWEKFLFPVLPVLLFLFVSGAILFWKLHRPHESDRGR